MIAGIVRLATRNPVLLNLAFWTVVVAGVLGWLRLAKEEFPQVSTDRVTVVVPWPGAGPADLVDQVIRPLEDALDGVEGLAHLYADATEGRALLQLEFTRGTDVEAARDDVQQAVDGVDDLPDDAFLPRVGIARLQIPLAHVGLLGDPRRIDVAERLRAGLQELPGVRDVAIQGAWERQIRVVVDPAEAAARGLRPESVVAALQAATSGSPAGSVSQEGRSVLVRTVDALRRVEDLAELPLTAGDGLVVRVGDVARVTDHWEPPDIEVRVNGRPAIDLLARPVEGADVLAIVPQLYAWAETIEGLPPGLEVVVFDDSARLLRQRIETLAINGLAGGVLVGLALVVFIGMRNALLVLWGLPVAYLGAVAMMYLTGTSVNVVSTFGLLLVTGIVVDDAIVVVENVQRHLEQGKNRLQAAYDGTVEVAPAVLAAVSTTCLAFAPLLMLGGTVGQVMAYVPTVVILALVASLFEALVVLPGHLAHHAQEHRGGAQGESAPAENTATRWVKAVYKPVLRFSTHRRWRWPVLGMLVVFVLGALSLSLVMRKSLTTAGNPVFAFINVDLAPGSDREATTGVVRQVEATLAELAPGDMVYAAGRVGEQISPQGFPVWGERHGQVKVGFVNTPEVMTRVGPVLDQVRERFSRDPRVVEFGLETLTGGPPAGKAIDVRVRGQDDEVVERAAEALRGWLASRGGVEGLRVDLAWGAEAARIEVDAARAATFGLQPSDVARAVRVAHDGVTAVELPVAGRTTEVRVQVGGRPEPSSLGDLPLILADGRVLRLEQVASVTRAVDRERLSRVDGLRSVQVTADVDDGVTTAVEERVALASWWRGVSGSHPGVTLFYGGELADTEESFAELPGAALLATLLVYGVLAIQFRSYLQPLLILSAVPLGLAGCILGLAVFGLDLSLIAMIGAVGLIGIVVNDSLVMVDFINHARRRGAAARDAVVEAATVRLRPILITTITTVSGLFPLAVGLGGDEPLLAPMAVAISVGLLFATALTLVAIPVLYLALEDLQRWAARWLPPSWREEEAAP